MTAEAELSIEHLRQITPGFSGCAILAGDGQLLACTGDPGSWQTAAAQLFEAADAAGEQPGEHVHVATEDGEVFGLREAGLSMICVTGRFPLASLMVFDMRTALRGLTGREPE